jgi:DNA invertase Pin-like site-specific DNA recombinase
MVPYYSANWPGPMMMQMLGAFAEFERAMLRERTKAGLDNARRQGRIGGRLYAWFPLLHRLAPQAEMFVGALAAGFVFFLAATLLVACFSRPLSVNDKIERQLKRRGHNKAKHRSGVRAR